MFTATAVVGAGLAITAACLLSDDALEQSRTELRARGEKLSLADLRPDRRSSTKKGSADRVDVAVKE